MTQDLHLRLWAKSDPCHDLWRHLLDVAAVCQALLPRFGPLEEMPAAWVCYLCALHDIGKADPWFQNKDTGLAQKLRDLHLELPAWSDAISEAERYFRHEARSHEWLLDHLTQQHGWGKRPAQVVMHSINGHHGNFAASCYSESKLTQQRAQWQPLRAQLAQLVWDVLQPPTYAPQAFHHAGALGVHLAGLVVLADWIASNADIYNYTQLHQYNDAPEYFRAAQQQAAEVVAKMKLDAPTIAPTAGPLHFADVWPGLTEPPRPSQQALENVVLSSGIAPGLAIIEAPMGEGKTEGAIYLGEYWNTRRGAQGFYLGLPTQATSNQIHKRYTAYLKARRPDAAPRLVHGMAWLLDDVAPTTTAQTFGNAQALWEERFLSREWFRPLRRALLAPDGVGTVDQVLLAALHVKFGVLRWLGLRTKVLVVDEAHAYDAYMTTILQQLLKWCRALEIPVILLSATLSARQKKTLVAAYGGDLAALNPGPEEPYPLLTFVALDGATRSIPVPYDAAPNRELRVEPNYGCLDDANRIAQLALQRVADGGCACVLMNTVKGAQAVYEAIEALLQKGEFARPDALELFHARFRAERRSHIEKTVTDLFGKDATIENGQRPRRAILVATQVVEQSLDVDFDFLLTQIAPIDLLLQRSGRLWRHLRQTRFSDYPTLDILMPDEENLEFGVSGRVYALEVLLRTLAVLYQRDAIHLPTEFRPLIEAVYGEVVPPSAIVPAAAIAEAAAAWANEQAQAKDKAKVNLLPDPNARVFNWIREDKPEADEGAAKNYLRISTRLGDESRAALVLNDQASIEFAQKSQDANYKPKGRDLRLLRQLFEQKVNLPTWWLQNKTPADGFEALFEGENWLRGHVIVPLRNGIWRNAVGATIEDNVKLGLTFTPAAQEQDKEEADAGVT